MRDVLVPAEPRHLEAIKEALLAVELPFADLTVAHLPGFLVATDMNGAVTRCAGVEVFEAAALLRSVAIAPSLRGAGAGRGVVRAIEGHARQRGVSEVYVLTTTAAGFFQRLGYQRCDRAAAPAAIRQTAEFAGLCPDTAQCLTKSLV